MRGSTYAAQWLKELLAKYRRGEPATNECPLRQALSGSLTVSFGFGSVDTRGTSDERLQNAASQTR